MLTCSWRFPLDVGAALRAETGERLCRTTKGVCEATRVQGRRGACVFSHRLPAERRQRWEWRVPTIACKTVRLAP